jgi:1,2-phenylacetyl-CoA epoxidase catalytic subunit
VDELGVSAEYLEHEWPKGEIRSMNVPDDPPTSWEDFIATAYLVESAMWEMLSTFQDSQLDSLAGLVLTVGRTERVHNLYFLGWMKNREETEEAKYIEALRRRAPSVLQWFGPPEDDGSLLERGIRSRSVAEARGRFLSRLEHLPSDVGLSKRVDLDSVPESFDWTGWVREYRRPDRDGPPAGLMEFIRPTHSLALLARRPRVNGEG